MEDRCTVRPSAVIGGLPAERNMQIFEVARTRIVSNQRGYPGEESGFQPSLVIDLDTPHSADYGQLLSGQ